jgi:hypothetical protein
LGVAFGEHVVDLTGGRLARHIVSAAVGLAPLLLGLWYNTQRGAYDSRLSVPFLAVLACLVVVTVELLVFRSRARAAVADVGIAVGVAAFFVIAAAISAVVLLPLRDCAPGTIDCGSPGRGLAALIGLAGLTAVLGIPSFAATLWLLRRDGGRGGAEPPNRKGT